MIILHYDLVTGDIVQAYDSNTVKDIPIPNVTVHEEQWAKMIGKDIKVDLLTKKVKVKNKVPTNEEQKSKRAQAYIEEADPIFFKYQREEATKQEWLDKIQEIKERYPYYN